MVKTVNKKQIEQRIRERLAYYQEHYNNEWVGIFLQGSQNYGLDTEGSDVDTKIIVLPRFEDIVLNKKPVSATLVLPNNEHCDVKDIRLMFDCFRKQNVNFLEILFTEYKVMNQRYADLFKPMFTHNEMIARYDSCAGINCMCGMVREKHKSMTHPTPATEEVIKKYGYNGKDLCHMWRIADFAERFYGRTSNSFVEAFSSCLKPESKEQHEAYMNAKQNNYVLEYVVELADSIDKNAKKFRERYMDSRENFRSPYADTVMNRVLMDIMTKSIKRQLE